MNTIEKAMMHALLVHLHHNIDKAIEALNNQVFIYKGKQVAVIPNQPSKADFEELEKGS